MSDSRFYRLYPKYAEEIKQANDPSLEPILTEKGEPNFYRMKGGERVYIHSQKGAIEEAERWFSELPHPESIDTLYVFGLGLGYATIPLKKWLRDDSRRLLVILEDDFPLLSKFLETERADALLDDPQIVFVPFRSKREGKEYKVSNDFEEVLDAAAGSNYFYSPLPANLSSRGGLSEYLHQYLHLRMGDHTWHLIFLEETHFNAAMKNIYENLFALPGMRVGDSLFGRFSGIPAVICGAGPSIATQLPLLKTLRNKALIFGAGTGMNTLNAQGIFPHFGCGMDPNLSSVSRIMTNTAFEVPYFCITQFQYKALKLLHGEKLFFRGVENYKADEWFHLKLGMEGQKKLHFVVSTSCACLALAKELGNRPIILVGLDLSYTEKKRYTKTIKAHAADRNIEKLFIEEMPREQLLPAKNHQGKEIFTRIDWLNEGIFYSSYAENHPELSLINATKEGLAIASIPHVELEKVVDEQLRESFDLDNWVHAEVICSPKLTVTSHEIETRLKEWGGDLQKGRERVLAMSEELLKVDKEVKEGRHIPDEIESARYRNLQEQFRKQESYPFFKLLETVYEQLSTRERIRLQYHPESFTKEEKFRGEMKLRLVRLMTLQGVAANQLKVIDEVLQARKEAKKPENVPFPSGKVEGTYDFDGKNLVLEDRDLGLSYRKPFSPKRVESAPSTQQWIVAGEANGKPDGECLLFNQDGSLRGKWYYKEGRLHGPTQFFSKEGTLVAKGWFIEDRKQGKNWQYYSSGSPYSLTGFVNGEFHGRQEYYYEEGGTKTVMHFVDGVLDGEVTLFYPNGQIKRQLRFSQGLLDGKEYLWSQEGIPLIEAEYRLGQPIGRAYSWYENGKLETEVIYRDAPDHYDERRWSPEGKLIYENLYLPKGLDGAAFEGRDTRLHTIQQLRNKLKNLLHSDS